MIPDDKFIKDPKVPGPTKEEIRCLVMCKAQIDKKDSVLDIGCGTGGLTVEASLRAAEVHALDKNTLAVEITRQNLEKHNPQALVKLYNEDALSIIPDLPPLDVVIIGGSGGDLHDIIHNSFEKLKKGGRMVITSILLQTRVIALETLENMGLEPEIVEIFVARGQKTSLGTMMSGNNPIAIIKIVK